MLSFFTIKKRKGNKEETSLIVTVEAEGKFPETFVATEAPEENKNWFWELIEVPWIINKTEETQENWLD